MNDGGAGAGGEKRVSGEDETLFVEGFRIQGSAPPRRRAGGAGSGGMGVAVAVMRRARVSNAWDCLAWFGEGLEEEEGGSGRCVAVAGDRDGKQSGDGRCVPTSAAADSFRPLLRAPAPGLPLAVLMSLWASTLSGCY